MAAQRYINNFSAPSSANVRTGQEMNIRDGSFELKPALINMVQQSPFCGKASEDADAHLQHFFKICSTFTIQGLTQDAVCLRLFPFSLLGKAKQWFYFNKEAVSTWEKCSNDRILESIDSKLNNFTVVVQNQLNFNKVLETRRTQLAAVLPHPNGGDFHDQPAVPVKENVKAVIIRSMKTMAEPKAKSKKINITDPVEEEEKAKAEVEAELRPGKEEENLGKASPKDISDTHLLQFHRQARKPVEDEKFSHFMEVIQRMYIHIPMLDPMQVPTYARYLNDNLNHKRPIPETDRLVFVERCSSAILDGIPDKMGDPGIPTISCLIGTQKFDQALCDLRASVSLTPKVIFNQLNHDSLVPTSMHLQLVDQSIRHLV
jgi:hypothetical protein